MTGGTTASPGSAWATSSGCTSSSANTDIGILGDCATACLVRKASVGSREACAKPAPRQTIDRHIAALAAADPLRASRATRDGMRRTDKVSDRLPEPMALITVLTPRAPRPPTLTIATASHSNAASGPQPPVTKKPRAAPYGAGPFTRRWCDCLSLTLYVHPERVPGGHKSFKPVAKPQTSGQRETKATR